MGRLALIALLLSSCHVAKPDCHTKCGMAVFGVSAQECARLNAFEGDAIVRLEYLYPRLCERFGTVGLRVWDVKGGSWTAPNGQKVAGLTYCDLATVEVAGTDWHLNAYMHEMAHVAQCPFQDYAHETWGDAGIFAALAEP